MVPIAVGVILVLGAGGAWVVLNGGNQTNGTATDSARVAQDTAPTQKSPQNGGGETRHAGGLPPATPPAPPAATSRINVGRARDALDDLFLDKLTPATAAMVRDSALKFYNAPGMSVKDKAYAAFVTGQAYFSSGDRPLGCRYVREANQLDPTDNTYSGLLGQCQ